MLNQEYSTMITNESIETFVSKVNGEIESDPYFADHAPDASIAL